MCPATVGAATTSPPLRALPPSHRHQPSARASSRHPRLPALRGLHPRDVRLVRAARRRQLARVLRPHARRVGGARPRPAHGAPRRARGARRRQRAPLPPAPRRTVRAHRRPRAADQGDDVRRHHRTPRHRGGAVRRAVGAGPLRRHGRLPTRGGPAEPVPHRGAGRRHRSPPRRGSGAARTRGLRRAGRGAPGRAAGGAARARAGRAPPAQGAAGRTLARAGPRRDRRAARARPRAPDVGGRPRAQRVVRRPRGRERDPARDPVGWRPRRAIAAHGACGRQIGRRSRRRPERAGRAARAAGRHATARGGRG
jgi:hypothetical protein